MVYDVIGGEWCLMSLTIFGMVSDVIDCFGLVSNVIDSVLCKCDVMDSGFFVFFVSA